MGINAAVYSSNFISGPKILAYTMAVARIASNCEVMQWNTLPTADPGRVPRAT